MNTLQCIRNAQLPGYQGRYQIEISTAGIIETIRPDEASPFQPLLSLASREAGSQQAKPIDSDATHAADATVLDVRGDWVSPGGVDVQINGALGLAFPDLSDRHIDTLVKICRFLWAQGVDAFLPTLVTTSIDNIHRALAAIATTQQQLQESREPETADILGVHLEGPFLNPAKRGAHPKEHLQPLTIETVQRVLGAYNSLVKVITLAPELDKTGTVIPYLRSLGITISLGHSQATEAEANRAFDQGATMVTHAFNAMPGLHHRQPGLLGAALVHPQVSCGLIADGQHVCPTMLDILLRVNRGGEPGLFLVSDALAPLGLPDGTYPWDTRQITVQDGTARLDDGTLAGTTHPLLVGAQNLVKWNLCEPEEAIALATLAPRTALGLPALKPGQPAHLLRWTAYPENNTLTGSRLCSYGQLG